jgi:hypothetical protein
MNIMAVDRFAVIQDVYELKDWQIAAALLTETCMWPVVTANQRARRSHGYLADNLEWDSARRLQEACAARGLIVHVVPQDEVIPVIKPVRTYRIWIADDALWVRANDRDEKTSLPWDTLRLLVATKTTKTESFLRWTTMASDGGEEGLALKLIPYTDDYTEYMAHVFAISPQGQVSDIRLFSRRLNYAEALGNMAPDAMADANARREGFRLLLGVLAKHAPGVYIPQESQALLATPPPGGTPKLPSTSPSEFDAYARWLFQRLLLQDSGHGSPERR